MNSLVKITRLKNVRCLGTLATNLIWKASEDDPLKLGKEHIGLYYQMPMNNLVPIFGTDQAFKKEYQKFYNVIGMMPIMVREPSIKTIDYLKKVDFNNQQNLRILLYGDPGHGKSCICTHLVHYLHAADEYVVVYVRDMKKFTMRPSDQEESLSRVGRLDTPLDAAIMLQKLKTVNRLKIESLVTSKEYNWSSKEFTAQGEPLINIIEHGVNRLSHASDCLAVLLKELALAADENLIKLVTVLDNVQFLYTHLAYDLKHADRKFVTIDEITVARALKKLISGSHKGSVTIATCDDKLSGDQNQVPMKVLGEEGWKAFDPCLPINVPKYNRGEFESCMNFMQDVGWLTRPEAQTIEGRDEIRFNSGLNPRQVHYLCQSL